MRESDVTIIVGGDAGTAAAMSGGGELTVKNRVEQFVVEEGKVCGIRVGAADTRGL